MSTECSINTGGVSDLIFVYEASEHRVLWSSGITGDTGLSVMKVMGRKLVTSSLSQPETHQMRSQNVIICSPVCLHLRVFTMINSGLSPHICVAMVRPWLVSVYLSGIIPVSPHSPDLTLATAQTWPWPQPRPDQDLFTAVQGCQEPGENGPMLTFLTDLLSLRHHQWLWSENISDSHHLVSHVILSCLP